MLLRRNGSEIPVSDSAAPIRDAQGEMVGAVMVFRDISIEEPARSNVVADPETGVGGSTGCHNRPRAE